ncbi:ARM repeat superfamily protein isoform 2 [Hibiscus syriacus]|uniref:ARM repeat superfamily protein isoform 2 n=1 Tax=Hibiscus syriacus TaxID=106335 RepID=A0A6A2X9V2_HIBSY|nr:ARM repeat superfamily protein isoform 2 [Hibiscus syriacus]
MRGLIGSEDGLLSLSNCADPVLPSLSLLLSDDKVKFQNQLLKLVNLSQNAGLAAKMVEMGMIKIAMDLLSKPGSSITRLLVMLLVNLTQLDDGISSLLQTGDDKMQGLYIKKLVSGTIRNCCFEAENQLQNLLLISEFLWPARLLPVAGSKVAFKMFAARKRVEGPCGLSMDRDITSGLVHGSRETEEPSTNTSK